MFIQAVLIRNEEWLFQHQVVVGGWMMILEGPSLCITEDKSKGEVDFENSWLVSKNALQLFSEAGWVDRRQAKIIPILKSVVATKPGTNLWPVLSVHLGNIFFATGNKVGWNENRIRLPASSGVFSTCCGSWFWSGTRTCLVRPLRSFRGRSICSFLSSAFSSCSGGLLMSGANMSVVRCAVVECFATSITGESAFGSSLIVRFQMLV